MITKVVGVTFSNEDGSSRARIIAGMTESDKVCLERDPYNQYDANAVKVCVLKNGEKKQIGFLSKDIAADVSSKLRRNVNFEVTIQGVGIWNDRPFCEIDITEAASAPAPQAETKQGSSGPSFTPNRPSSPIFTPNKPSTPSAASTNNNAVSNVAQTRVTLSASTSRPSSSYTRPTSSQSTSQSSNNSGCLSIVIGVVVVLSAFLIF